MKVQQDSFKPKKKEEGENGYKLCVWVLTSWLDFSVNPDTTKIFISSTYSGRLSGTIRLPKKEQQETKLDNIAWKTQNKIKMWERAQVE